MSFVFLEECYPLDHSLFIWGFTSLSTQYRLYHDGKYCGQRKPVHTVGQGSVNCQLSVSNYQLSNIRSGGLNRQPQMWEASVLPLAHRVASLVYSGLVQYNTSPSNNNMTCLVYTHPKQCNHYQHYIYYKKFSKIYQTSQWSIRSVWYLYASDLPITKKRGN